jgi:hypothetical protein
MNPTQILSLLSALAAAIWSVWTWNEEQQKQRDLKRDQEAALYVNPLIIATEELQSRLYSILEEDELAFYKRQYPDQYEFGSPAAIEILYRLCQYFGWAFRVFRYGPYTRDPNMIEYTRHIAETFEDRSRFFGEAFLFSIDERVSLGEVVVRRAGEATAILPVFETIPLYQFQSELSNEESKHAPLFQSRAVRSTLKAIDDADCAEALEGHDRLAVLQNLLVDLVAYLESKEGFSVSVGERKRARLPLSSIMTSRVPSGGAATSRILHQTRGRIRLKIDRLKTDEAYSDHLQSILISMENVTNVRISRDAASVVINYSPDIAETDFAVRLASVVEGC